MLRRLSACCEPFEYLPRQNRDNRLLLSNVKSSPPAAIENVLNKVKQWHGRRRDMGLFFDDQRACNSNASVAHDLPSQSMDIHHKNTEVHVYCKQLCKQAHLHDDLERHGHVEHRRCLNAMDRGAFLEHERRDCDDLGFHLGSGFDWHEFIKRCRLWLLFSHDSRHLFGCADISRCPLWGRARIPA